MRAVLWFGEQDHVEIYSCVFQSELELRVLHSLRIVKFTKLTPAKICRIHRGTEWEGLIGGFCIDMWIWTSMLYLHGIQKVSLQKLIRNIAFNKSIIRRSKLYNSPPDPLTTPGAPHWPMRECTRQHHYTLLGHLLANKTRYLRSPCSRFRNSSWTCNQLGQ